MKHTQREKEAINNINRSYNIFFPFPTMNPLLYPQDAQIPGLSYPLLG